MRCRVYGDARSASIARQKSDAISAPAACAATNAATSTGRIPENVGVNARATVTTGLANDVDAVNQPQLVQRHRQGTQRG